MRLLISCLMVVLAFAVPSLTLTTSVAGAVDIVPTCTDSEQPVQSQTDYCKDASTQNQSTTNPIISFIKIAINVVSFIGGIAAVIILIVSGIRMTVSNGDSNAIGEARNGVIYSLVGIAVIVLAQTLVIFVLDKIK